VFYQWSCDWCGKTLVQPERYALDALVPIHILDGCEWMPHREVRNELRKWHDSLARSRRPSERLS